MRHTGLHWRGGRFLVVEDRDFVVVRKQPEGLQVQALVLVMVAERQVFVLVVVGLMVFVVGVMQLYVAANAEPLLVADDVVDEVVNELPHFHQGADALTGRRGRRQQEH